MLRKEGWMRKGRVEEEGWMRKGRVEEEWEEKGGGKGGSV